MAIIDGSLKADIEVAYREKRLKPADQVYRQIMQVVPTRSDSKAIYWEGARGRLRRFRAERQPSGSGAIYKSFAILDEWEHTKVYKKKELDDNPNGERFITDAGGFAQIIDRSLYLETVEALRAGVSRYSYDRAQFFSFNHAFVDEKGITRGDGWSNMNLAGQGITVSTIQTAQEYFSTFVDDTGENDAGVMTHVMVRRGSQNAINAKLLANSASSLDVNVNQGVVNPYAGAFEVLEVEAGIGMNEWVALDLSDPTNLPLVLLNHSVSPGIDNMEFSVLDESSESGFWRREVGFGVYGRFDWNPGDPRTAYLFGATTYSFSYGVDYESKPDRQANLY